MKLRIKKFKLRRDGVTYRAGAVIDLPDTEAAALASGSPDLFEVVVDTVPQVPDTPDDPEDLNLDEMTIAQLKAFAKENGIDIGDASKKQDIIDAIVAAAEPQEPEGLPDVDLKETVK